MITDTLLFILMMYITLCNAILCCYCDAVDLLLVVLFYTQVLLDELMEICIPVMMCITFITTNTVYNLLLLLLLLVEGSCCAMTPQCPSLPPSLPHPCFAVVDDDD